MHNLSRPGQRLLCFALLCALADHSSAFTIAITATNPRTVYLQVGVGTFTGGWYASGGTPGNNTTINTVSAAVPATSVGNGAPQGMETDSAVAASSYDGRAFCSAPAQLYIGGFYRRAGNAGGPGGATVTATVPAALTDTTGDTIPFSQISWTSSGVGDVGAEPFPAGTFVAGGTQSIGTIAKNEWAESCWSFSYANTTVQPAGTYTGTVLYTLAAP